MYFDLISLYMSDSLTTTDKEISAHSQHVHSHSVAVITGGFVCPVVTQCDVM